MTAVIIAETSESIASLDHAWRHLWQHSSPSHPFCQPDWVQHWLRTLGRSARPYVLATRSGEAIEALAPLSAETTPLGTIIRPAGHGVSDYSDWLLPDPPEQRRQAITDLAGALIGDQRWLGLELTGLRNGADLEMLELACAVHGVPTVVMPGLHCPYVDLPDGFEAYYRSRPSRLRYNVRSRERRLSLLGPVAYHHASANEAPGLLEEAIHLHARRWQGQHTSTVFSASAAGRAFYRAAIPAAVADGTGDLAVMTLGGSVIAASIGFARGTEYHYYLPAWHLGYLPYAPSSLLLAHLIRHAADRGALTFDFMLGDEPYKATWATGQRTVQTLLAARPTAAGRAWLAARRGYAEVRARARASSTLAALRRYGLRGLRHTGSTPREA